MNKVIVFLVRDLEQGIEEWAVCEDGKIVDKEGDRVTDWIVLEKDEEGNPTHFSIYEGGHWEYGDRNETVEMESNRTDEFFTLNRSRAEARLAELQAKEDGRQAEVNQEARNQALFREYGLDDESVRMKREDILRKHGLL